jgi:NAD kinase
MVFVPLNAHNLATRALAVPGSSRLELHVDERTHLVLDGAVRTTLAAQQLVTCRLDGPPMQLVKVEGAAGFYQQLREKMTWGRPLVREGRR